jgi:hypothetical protein
MIEILTHIFKYFWEHKVLRPFLLNFLVVLFASFAMYFYVETRHDEAMAQIEIVKTEQHDAKDQIKDSLSEIKRSIDHMEDRIDDLHRILSGR